MGHGPISHQTRLRSREAVPLSSPLPQVSSNELHIRIHAINKLYTDDTGRFPVQARSGNQYIMVAYHCNRNAILACLLKTRKDTHRLQDHSTITGRLRDCSIKVNLQILDNEASAEQRRQTTEDWKCDYQLVPPSFNL